MAGANYMGGRRNIARARAKDVTGRKQKGHFMKHKHQILARGLREQAPNDNGEPPSIRPGRLEQIDFTHARKDLQTDPGRTSAEASLGFNTSTKNRLLPSSSPGSVRQSQVRKSKLLESLDINDPLALRATVQRILAQSDLAGLSGRPLPRKDRARLETVIENPRKKQKSSEVTSTSSSSSFRYESPTRKATFNKTLLPTKKGSSRLPTYSAISQRLAAPSPRSHSSLNLNQGTSVGNSSFDSSLDRLSAIQEAGSVSSFPDSGFSELHFTDDSELWYKKNGSYRSDGSVQRRNEQEPCSVEAGSSSDSPLGSLSFKVNTEGSGHPRELYLPGYSFELQGAITPPPSKDRNNPAHCSNSPAHWFDLDEITNSQSLPEDASERAVDLEDDGRYGVGYVPTDSGVRYKPYVPLATMLPSYSDDTEADLDGSVAARDVEKDVAMDIDFERIDQSANDEEQSASLAEERFPSPRIQPSLDIHSKVPSESASQLLASSVSYDSQPHNRPHFVSFLPGHSRRSTFSAQSNEDEDLPCSRSTTLLSRNQISPFRSYSESAMASGGFWTPNDEATRNCLNDVEDLSSRSTNQPPNSHSPLQDYQGHIDSLPTTDTSLIIDHPNASIVLDPHQENDQQYHCAGEGVLNTQFFDGPDLFTADEDDDDDDD